jgi:3D-(3,5/4)-trihydroxycyclohexane-1,2-dione acylhydrolase (decyclizing)
MNSDIYSSVLTRKKLIILVLDNGGFAVINKLQNNTGNESFNNLIADCPTVPEALRRRFRGACGDRWGRRRNGLQPGGTGEAFKRAKASRQDHVIVMKVDAYDGWTTQGHAWWEVGTPHVTDNPKVKRCARGAGSDPRQTAQGCVRRCACQTQWARGCRT